MSGDGVLQQMAASLAAMAGELAQLRAENAQLRQRLEQALLPAETCVLPTRRYRLRELYREWRRDGLPDLEAAGKLSPSRVYMYRKLFKVMLMTRIKLSPTQSIRFGSLYWDEATKQRGQAFRTALRATVTRYGTTHKDNSINLYLGAWMSCLTWHAENGRVLGKHKLCGKGLTVSEKQFRRKSRCTYEEWCEFLEPCPPIVRDIERVEYLSSMRPTETRELLKDEWHPATRTIELSEREGCKTGGRPIVVNHECAEIINRRMAESRGPYVFVYPPDPSQTKPVPEDYIGRYMRRARKYTKNPKLKKAVAYLGRHGGANDSAEKAAAAGIPISDVAARTGHSVATFIANYHDQSPGSLKRFRDALEVSAASVVVKQPHP